jgi:hypothetical protein
MAGEIRMTGQEKWIATAGVVNGRKDDYVLSNGRLCGGLLEIVVA